MTAPAAVATSSAPLLTRMPVGARVRHGDGAYGRVARVVASTSGMPLNLIAWDDLSQTRGGDDVWLVDARA